VEDTDVTIEDLEREFPEAVTEVIKLLTHEKDVNYFDYVRKIQTNPVATKVKLEDLKHNSDETRNTGINVPEEKRRYWAEKYAKAKALLLQ
jgi:(p)ppGpp synthase/HD superfamily hydrolase